jgi:HK97 family phage portal protein
MISNLLLRGDGLAEIIRNRQGVPVGFMPLPRECVKIDRRGNELVYYISDGVSKPYGRVQDDILHFPGFGFSGTCGESVIKNAARNAIGSAIAADEYSGEYFANGANPSVVVQYPEGVSPKDEQLDYLRKQLEDRTTGQGKRHKPLLLVNGGSLNPVSLSAEDSQLLQTRQFQVVDIARAFGVPPHMLGEQSTVWGSGLEQISGGFVRYTMNPYLSRIEQELNRKLWPRSQKYFVEFNREGLLAGDSKAEAEYFAKALGGPGTQGWMSVDEVRRVKNLPPDGNPKMSRVIEAGAKPVTQPEEKAA